MNKQQFLNTGLLEQFALGLTNAEESAIVEQHLDKFPELRDELYAMHEALENYAKQYAITPPEKVKGKIMDEIHQGSPHVQGAIHTMNPAHSVWSKWLSYAALIALTLGYIYQSNRFKNSQQDLREAKASLSSCERQNTSLEGNNKVYAMLSDIHTQPVTLLGTAVSPESEAIVYWNESKQQAYFIATALPEPPEDKQYQIWADVDGEMISIGLLEYQTDRFQTIEYIAHAESLNITLEPKGGSEAPTVSNLYVNAPLRRS